MIRYLLTAAPLALIATAAEAAPKPKFGDPVPFADGITFDPMMLKHLIDRFGAEHVLMGTDYPSDMGEDDPRGLIAAVKGLPAAQRKQIEGLNAMKLLKIKL